MIFTKRTALLVFTLIILLTACNKQAEFTSGTTLSYISEASQSIEREYTDVTLKYVTKKVKKGYSAQIIIIGQPYTAYDISVYYGKSKSTSKYLVTHKSDKNGTVRWKWTVGSNTKSDTATIKIYRGVEPVLTKTIKLI